MDAETVGTIRDAISADVKDDYIGIWVIPWWLARLAPELAVAEVKVQTLGILRLLLDAGEIRLGDVAENGREFRAWEGTTEQLLSKVSKAWTELGRVPNIGEIGWLDEASG